MSSGSDFPVSYARWTFGVEGKMMGNYALLEYLEIEDCGWRIGRGASWIGGNTGETGVAIAVYRTGRSRKMEHRRIIFP
jgi:hypothetical protein